ncbi:RPM1 interacting protein 13-like [Beta vulgaris subsp. vulgaris]|uniref:RPM1 interacting protein 13-like n=1 Tax=Beta vulgaris subsp. vulgaris TaxID=3555 RepID=UPI0020375924|nr:RPM1 interacting protein 13-like [Beta vulgaris subsp. vulgaris]
MGYIVAESDADLKPPKEEFSPKTSIISLKDMSRLREIEEIEDCFILESNPYDSLTTFPTLSKLLYDDDDDLDTVEQGEVACRDYPHSRHLCAMHPFYNTPHYNHCKMCYCYVCDMPAPCEQWTEQSSYFKHCEATPDIQIWRDLRTARKRNIHIKFDEIYSQLEYVPNFNIHTSH